LYIKSLSQIESLKNVAKVSNVKRLLTSCGYSLIQVFTFDKFFHRWYYLYRFKSIDLSLINKKNTKKSNNKKEEKEEEDKRIL